MESITSLEQLRRNLTLGPGYEGFVKLLQAIEFPPEEYRSLCRWNEKKYQRIRLYDTESLEALLTCWLPGHATPVHNYHQSRGWAKVLEGTLRLERLDLEREGALKYERELKPGEITLLDDALGFHRFINPGPTKAIALVFYADRIDAWEVWDPETGKIEEREVICDLNLDPRP